MVVCEDNVGNVSRHCDASKKPPMERSCNSEPCPSWNFGAWAKVTMDIQTIPEIAYSGTAQLNPEGEFLVTWSQAGLLIFRIKRLLLFTCSTFSRFHCDQVLTSEDVGSSL